MDMMNIWIGTAMSYFGKQVFSLMLFHLFFIAAPGQNQDKCSNLMWSLDKLRIREDKNLLQKFSLVHSKHLCTFYVLDSHGFKKVSCCCCCCEVASVVPDSVRPHGRQPTRLPSLGFSRQEYWNGLPFPSPMHESEKWKWSRSVVSDS